MYAFCVFDAKSFGSEERTVPLVVYENGQRRVIGEATLRPDEIGLAVEGRISDPEMAKQVHAVGVTARFTVSTDSKADLPRPEGESPMTEQ